ATTTITNGTLNLTGPGGALGAVAVSGLNNGNIGILNVNTSTPSSAASFTLQTPFGARGGSGTLNVSGTMTWSAGTLAGVTNANGPLFLTGANEKYFPSGTLSSNFSATWSGTGNLRFDYGGPTLNIAAGTTFDVQTDAGTTGSGGASFMAI